MDEQLLLPFPPDEPPDIVFTMIDGDIVTVHYDAAAHFKITSQNGDYINEMIIVNEFKRLMKEIGGVTLDKWQMIRDHD